MTEPWKKIAWTQEHEQIIYREWGVFYTFKHQLDIAAYYYNKSLELKNDDFKALLYQSICKRYIAMIEEALKDGFAGLNIDPNNQPVNLAVCNAIYDLNQFENCASELHNAKRKFSGTKIKAFENKIDVVEENLKDTIGNTLGPFILQIEKYFSQILDDLMKKQTEDKRQLWKILREQGKCDVTSVIEKRTELLHPREVSRRFGTYKIFNQIYFNKSWTDILFLKEMHNNSELLLSQAKSLPFLKKQVESKYTIILKFLKMLQARNPLYTENFKRCPNKQLATKEREAHLYRVQYETRRFMFIILKRIKLLRKQRNIKALSKYIEDVMGDYIILKSRRVMPWRFEFINEVYNVLGLAWTDRLEIPRDLPNIAHADRLFALLRLPKNKIKDIVEFRFGDRSTYQEPDATDAQYIAYKKLLVRLEKRLYFAKYSIEKCYILHEIANNHLMQSKYDECISVAKKVVEESQNCQNKLWKFLGQLLICKSNISQNKVERVKESFEKASLIAEKLQNVRITHFIAVCREINLEDIESKKKRLSLESMVSSARKKKSSFSVSIYSTSASAMNISVD